MIEQNIEVRLASTAKLIETNKYENHLHPDKDCGSDGQVILVADRVFQDFLNYSVPGSKYEIEISIRRIG